MVVMKKSCCALIGIIIITVVLCFFDFSAMAMETMGENHTIYYTVYNENGEIVQEGVIPQYHLDYNWKSDIVLQNGWYTSFRMNGTDAFYVSANTKMHFSYKLNRNAKICYQYMKSNNRVTTNAYIWRSGVRSGSSSNIEETADGIAYYYVGIPRSI